MIIRLVVAELFMLMDRQTDRSTDMTKIIEAICNFAISSKNYTNQFSIKCSTY